MNRHAPAPLHEIVYRRGRMAVFVGFLLALALFAALAYLRLGSELSESNRSKTEIILALVGLVLIVFLCHLHNAFLKRGATIHAAPEGLTLMASSTPVGPIPWREIRRIGPFRSTKHVLWFDKIGIELVDPDRVLKPFGRAVNRYKSRWGGGGAHLKLSWMLFDTSVSKASRELEAMRQRYG